MSKVRIKNTALQRQAETRGYGFMDAVQAAGQTITGGIEIEPHELVKVFNLFPEEPSLLKKAANAVQASSRVVTAIAMGEPIKVPLEVEAVRGGYCATCHLWMVEKATCSKCGCKGLKLHIATERCPMGHWDKFSETTI